MKGLIDTHCHVNVAEYFPDPNAAIEEAKRAGVDRLILVGLDPTSGTRAVQVAEAHEGVYAIVGRHPNYSSDYNTDELKVYEELLSHPKTVALGEIGLDFHWDYALRAQQEKALREQLQLARDLRKPVVFHCREAYPELLTILESMPAHPYLFHCFSGNADDAKRAVALDCYFGVDGPITYKKSGPLRAVLATLPQNRLLLETDSPYLTPEPLRGKPNSPANLPFVASGLAGVLNLTAEEVANLTGANADRFFQI